MWNLFLCAILPTLTKQAITDDVCSFMFSCYWIDTQMAKSQWWYCSQQLKWKELLKCKELNLICVSWSLAKQSFWTGWLRSLTFISAFNLVSKCVRHESFSVPVKWPVTQAQPSPNFILSSINMQAKPREWIWTIFPTWLQCDSVLVWMLSINENKLINQSAVKRLIAINWIQNKRFGLHNMCVCTVYIYYVHINTHT